MIIDAQVHAYERNHAGRPWVDHIPGYPEMTGDDLIAAMDAVGVDAAILVSPWSIYRYDASYAVSVRNRWPDRLALVKPVDIADPAVAEDVADWARTPGTVAIRFFSPRFSADPAAPGLEPAVSAAIRHGLPVNLACFADLGFADALAAAHPDCRFVIDHLGMMGPLVPPGSPEALKDLPQLLALARHANVAVKLSGTAILSPGPFPYVDLHEPIGRVIDAFGVDRCMWGTDWTRTADFLTYQQGVDAFRLHFGLSDGDRAALMGGTLRDIYNWTPAHG